MNKLFVSLTFFSLCFTVQANHTVFSCFNYVDTYEYSASLQGRNRGFDLCLKKYSVSNPEYNCSTLADRYYGLSSKKLATNKCLKQSSSVEGCMKAADTFDAIGTRSRAAMSCLKRFKNVLSEEICYSVGKKYSHIQRSVNQYCDQLFKQKMPESGKDSYLGDGSTEIIQFRNING